MSHINNIKKQIYVYKQAYIWNSVILWELLSQRFIKFTDKKLQKNFELIFSS